MSGAAFFMLIPAFALIHQFQAELASVVPQGDRRGL